MYTSCYISVTFWNMDVTIGPRHQPPAPWPRPKFLNPLFVCPFLVTTMPNTNRNEITWRLLMSRELRCVRTSATIMTTKSSTNKSRHSCLMAKSHGHMYWCLIFTSIGSSSLYYHAYWVRWRHIPVVDVQVSNCCQGIIMRHDKANTYWSDGMNRMKTSSNRNIFRIAGPLCGEFSPVTVEFPWQGPVTRSFDVFFDLCLNIRLSKQSRVWWFETPSRPLLRHCNGNSRSPYCHLTRSNSGCDIVF